MLPRQLQAKLVKLEAYCLRGVPNSSKHFYNSEESRECFRGSRPMQTEQVQNLHSLSLSEPMFCAEDS